MSRCVGFVPRPVEAQRMMWAARRQQMKAGLEHSGLVKNGNSQLLMLVEESTLESAWATR